MNGRRAFVDGKSIPIGNDPAYDYVADYLKARFWRSQSVTCGICRKPMAHQGRSVSPLYGTTGEMFTCECGANVTVSPVITRTKREENAHA